MSRTCFAQSRQSLMTVNSSGQNPDVKSVLELAGHQIVDHVGHTFDLLSIARPGTMPAAVNLVKTISKLSPFVANLLEQRVVDLLNEEPHLKDRGTWVRQDPDFPDAVFQGDIAPTPGVEIKAWFPLATEITARFRDSHTHFEQDQVQMALLAWLPDNIFFGQPVLIDACLVSAKSVAEARDLHYHRPPDYLVIEPEDTTTRTRNLQQTNTNGYKFQGTDSERHQAEGVVNSWGPEGKAFSSALEYQEKLRYLLGTFRYRLDTNFAKVDRIQHVELEQFKTRVLGREFGGLTLNRWARLLGGKDGSRIETALREHLAFNPLGRR